MGGVPGTPTSPAARTFFSPDGFWWWDGSAWKPALSEDRLWRWNGQAWEPSRLPPASSSGAGAGAGAAIGITVVVAFVLILVLVSIIVIVVLLTMGGQIANVFSNVAAALNGP
jgi:Flp pilus assembly pilin Flp